MHRFHPSRGRLAFELFCLLAVSASCAGAWLQTGASAMLGAAAATLLYAIVHAFDLKRPKPVASGAPQPVMVGSSGQVGIADAADSPVIGEITIEQAKPAAKSKPKAKARPAKAPGKRPRAATSREAPVVTLAPPEPIESTMLPAPEVAHLPLAPLFEPEPFARQQRTVFGRKAG